MSQAQLPKDNAWEAFEKASGKLRDAYKMERSKNCWIIRKFDKNSIAMGEAPWVVTDSGEVIRVGYPLSLEAVLAEVARRTENG
ncbi:hypothetical protein [Candidatus Nanosynsacchari sp. TM7_ANC_38.39_G1_1]|uniref:hypothetical protein n=1 Tax=Candidatus Nanosynsacchari sp. TM7_ANC_38.39_G1_1 TaxID=1986206 RepID=UPI00101D752D|nr:hypothetical protein [Candidatus Nanosynsacchari sp. TM7_ANC_38.39_G1_1]RYC72351.1 hypothetical protein G1ANC_00754 [Candidatus Nanosynsacchari sp. TM7_ANC_38.39_G1_1]